MQNTVSMRLIIKQIRKKEGGYITQIAILEQQLAQQKQEIDEAKEREVKYRQIYDQILRLINHRLGLKTSECLSFNVSFICHFKL